MATPILMPKLGQTVESCIITEWFVKVGDQVQIGDKLFSLETDKSSFTESSPVAGEVLAIFFEEGEDVPCLQIVAVIGKKGEDFSEFLPKEKTAAATKDKAEDAAADLHTKPQSAQVDDIQAAGSGFASPRARAAAARMKIDLRAVSGSGPGGRIIERDVLNFAGNGTALGGRYTAEELESLGRAHETSEEFVDVPHSGMRKYIAKAMHNSLASMAQLTHSTSFDATQLRRMREAVKKAEGRGVPSATINDMVLFAVSRVLLRHSELNAHYFDDKLRCFNSVNLGIATDTPRGLLVPTLFGADKMSLWEIAAESKKLIEAARSGSISPDLLKNGTFTVSNLGSLRIESFTPIINPPQTGILGVCAITDKVRMGPSSISVYPSMGLSLTYDHRALDGAPASRFLVDLCETLENFIDFYKSQKGQQYELDI